MKHIIFLACLGVTACGQTTGIGVPPALTPVAESPELVAMQSPRLPERPEPLSPAASASLWSGDRASLLGTRRAETRGDIVTVIIEIDDEAEFSNSSDRSRSGSETMAVPNLVGIPQRLGGRLPEGATFDDAVGLTSNSKFKGDGNTTRNERLTLRVAATVTEILPNGSFAIEGRQEVRLNYELRELVVTGFVRPEDISRRNEVLYDKIAAARISYGGRGQITDVQQPRYGQQVAEKLLPF
ncbi:flagellar basal body L-ring protein FlgH [Palleronia sp.]|uniref:flagellar basal body L-ring protein FlgH n=1 Tax=Palleronia sp. TaxID=1940284 RepID=UPI0035C7CCF3